MVPNQLKANNENLLVTQNAVTFKQNLWKGNYIQLERNKVKHRPEFQDIPVTTSHHTSQNRYKTLLKTGLASDI